MITMLTYTGCIGGVPELARYVKQHRERHRHPIGLKIAPTEMAAGCGS
jgi:Tfp pilus assembly protein PilP